MPARDPLPVTEEAVPVSGGRLSTTRQGSGFAVVLCHGGPGLVDNLAPLAGLIDDRAEVHRYDQRGTGRSTRTGPFDVATFVADLEALRAHWGHDRWVVGGHSWGATLALLYALEHPHRVAGVLAISGTGTRWGWQEATRRHRLARLSQADRTEMAALERSGSTASDRHLRLAWSTDFVDRAFAHAVLDAAPLYRAPRDPAVFRAVSASLRRVLDDGIEDHIRALAVPVLALHGAGDADPSRGQHLANLAPRGTFELIPDAGHSPWLEHPAAVRAAVARFLATVTP